MTFYSSSFSQFATAEDKTIFFSKGPTTIKSKRFQEHNALSRKTPSHKLKSSHAFIGDEIFFKRKAVLVKGTVVDYRTDTVIVEISESQAKALEISNCLTVVNHKNYQLV